jgi:peptidoglycan/LPS O-acetylase OafA/YrhL
MAKGDLIIGVLSGVGIATLIVALGQMFPTGGPEIPFALLLLGSFLTMAAFGFAAGRRMRSAWPTVLFGFGGIVAGVVANAAYDSVANHRDHNLFPFEIIMLAVLIMPGLILGMASGRSLKQQQK